MNIVRTEKAVGRARNRALKDYTGLRINKLEVLSLYERDPKWNNHKWLCRCDCGSTKPIGIKNVISGKTASCGCIKREDVAERNTTHGMSHLNGYRSWKDMRSRCNNPGDSDFKDYGGRGIVVCSRWDDFSLFIADLGDRPKGFTLDRIDVNGNYEPSNCRWADGKTQANNKRVNRIIEWNGRSQTLQQWCEETGIDHSKAGYRLRQGWPMEKVFSHEDFRK